MDAYTRSEAGRLGTGRRALEREVRSGTLSRIRHGGYTVAREMPPRECHRDLIQVTAGLLAPSSVVSHVSAAVVHGLPVPSTCLDVVTATRPRATNGGGNVSRHLHTYCLPVPTSDVVILDGIRVTSLARTAADAARVLPVDDAVVLLDAALHSPHGGEDADLRAEVAEQMQRMRRRRGGRAALEALRLADGASESPLESMSRLIFGRHGLPKPVLQFEVFGPHGGLVGRSDFAWPEFMVLGEADGRLKYEERLRPGERPADAVMREKRRENQLQALGWTVVRWTWEDLHNPADLCRRIGRLLWRERAVG